MAIVPPLTVQELAQVLLLMAKLPVGADGVVQVPATVAPTVVEVLRQPPALTTLAIIVCGALYVGKVELHVTPLSVEYCKVPPEPKTVPIEIEPPLTVQALAQLLLVIAKLPVGAAGVVQVPATVAPTVVLALRQLFTVWILARIVWGALYAGKMAVHVAPLSMEYSKVPPEPETVPMAIEPPLTVQALAQVLLVMAKLPVGATGASTVMVTLAQAVVLQVPSANTK